MSETAASSWPPSGWTVDDCLAWLGCPKTELGKTFDTAEARNAIGRWVKGSGGSSGRKTSRYRGALALGAREPGRRAKRLAPKRTLHGKAYEAESDAVHAPEEDQDEDAFHVDLAGARRAEQSKGKVVLEHLANGEDHPDDIRDSLMASYDEDRRNKPGWLTGRAAAEDRKHVEKAVDHYLANGGADQDLQDGEALHLSIGRSDDSLFAQARAEHEAHLKASGMKAADVKKELSGEADEARDKEKLDSVGRAAQAKQDERHATLKAAYPEEFAAADRATPGHERGYQLFKLGTRYEREHGKKLPY